MYRSGNSLLDNVSLEASHNYFYDAKKDENDNDDEDDEEENAVMELEFGSNNNNNNNENENSEDSHSTISSRTYVKVSRSRMIHLNRCFFAF